MPDEAWERACGEAVGERARSESELWLKLTGMAAAFARAYAARLAWLVGGGVRGSA